MKQYHPHKQPTMTAGELIEYLQKLDPELPVLATWEGVHAPLALENMSIDAPSETGAFPGQLCLVIDVEDYF